MQLGDVDYLCSNHPLEFSLGGRQCGETPKKIAILPTWCECAWNLLPCFAKGVPKLNHQIFFCK
jgi:hypothetical protein